MAIQLVVTTASASDVNVEVVPVANQTITIDRGLIGPAGPAGPTTLAVGTTTTGAAGTAAFVANSGTSTAAVFNFTIPQGAIGPAGAPGVGVPIAGTVGQVLTKNSSTNYDASWLAPEVTLAGNQTLTNKTISFASNTLTGVASLTTAQTFTNKTLTLPIISTISNSGTITLPTGTQTLVGRTTTDTLTNKTLTAPVISTISNTGVITLPTSTDTLVGKATIDTLTNKTLSSPVVTGSITEGVFAIVDGASVNINPANGTIQTWTLGATRTPTAPSFASGQSITLMINDGTTFNVVWTTMAVTWVGGSAPLLATTGFTVIELWKVSTTIYGAIVGYVA